MSVRALGRPLFLAASFALAACSGSGNGTAGNPFGNGPAACDPGTAVSDAQPRPNQSGVSITVGQIIIVANGSANTLHDNPTIWTITLADNLGGIITGTTLNPVPFPNGPHPYPSDFYYASNIPTLNPGRSYTVFLTRTDGTCSAVGVGSFST